MFLQIYLSCVGLGRAKALYDFAAEQEGDLGFSEGEIIVLTEATQTWWQGYREASGPPVGAFPSNYVELIPEEGGSTWVRVVGREHKSGQPSTPGSSTPTTPHDDPGEPLSGGGRPRLQRRRSSASLLVDLELWLSLEVGNATGGVDRITRSMTQFLELQQELAKDFETDNGEEDAAEGSEEGLEVGPFEGLDVGETLGDFDGLQLFVSKGEITKNTAHTRAKLNIVFISTPIIST